MPHVATYELEPGGAFPSGKPEKRLDLPFWTAPEQPPEASIGLIDRGQILVASEDGDLVDSDLSHALKRAVLEAIGDNHLDRPEDASPAGLEDSHHLVPGQSPGPGGQKDLVGVGHLLFPVRPGDPFHLDSVPGTVHPPGKVADHHPVAPQEDVVDFPGASTGVVDRSFPTADRKFGTVSIPGMNINDKNGILKPSFPNADIAVKESLESFHLTEYCFYKHWVSHLVDRFRIKQSYHQENSMFIFYPQILGKRLKN